MFCRLLFPFLLLPPPTPPRAPPAPGALETVIYHLPMLPLVRCAKLAPSMDALLPVAPCLLGHAWPASRVTHARALAERYVGAGMANMLHARRRLVHAGGVMHGPASPALGTVHEGDFEVFSDIPMVDPAPNSLDEKPRHFEFLG